MEDDHGDKVNEHDKGDDGHDHEESDFVLSNMKFQNQVPVYLWGCLGIHP